LRPPNPLSERGLTLTELTIVAVLACVVMLGMVGFYMSSQTVWMDGSTQAITQREATSVIEEMSRRIHDAAQATVECPGDPLHCRIELFDKDNNQLWAYWWRDSLLHEGPNIATDRGAMASSKVEVFQVVGDDDLVDIQLLQMRSAQGERVQMSTKIAFANHVPVAP
jgi:hypothetical protein